MIFNWFNSEYKVKDWELIDDSDVYRTIKSNYTYVTLEAVSFVDYPFDEHTECRIIIKGLLYFDGFRHLYIGENGEGYLYYMNTEKLIQLLQIYDNINKSLKDYN